MDKRKKVLTARLPLTVDVGHGFVQLVEVMGDDYTVIQSARISYAKAEADDPQAFLTKLVTMGHWSPFEMAEMRFKVKVPMDTWRQWIRHRTANVNEVSTRYTSIDVSQPLCDLCNMPDAGACDLNAMIRDQLQGAFNLYKELVEDGMPKQVARSILPLCTYTTAFWKMDLRNLIHFLRLRLDSHAQGTPGGIREYATAVTGLLKVAFPMVYTACITAGELTE